MPDSPSKIYVRAPNWVGDVVMATPALRALRCACPEASITVEAQAFFEGLLHGHPSIDAFVPAPARGLGPLRAHARLLAREGFDWAVLLPDSFRSAAPPFLARVPVRIGYARDLARRFLLSRVLDPPREGGRRVAISMIERYLRITRALGIPDAGPELDLVVDPAARARIAERLAGAGLEAGRGYAVVTPGASFGASKLWPTQHFAAACDGLAERLGLGSVIAPGPAEEDVARAVAEQSGVRPIVLDEPVTSLAELAALIDGAALLLGNDTGPRQIAVALRTPAVTLIGPTDSGHTDHLMDLQRVLREPVDCSPCHEKVCPIDHRCMTRLAPQRAIDAAAELLE